MRPQAEPMTSSWSEKGTITDTSTAGLDGIG
jgi:hypothetical protein